MQALTASNEVLQRKFGASVEFGALAPLWCFEGRDGLSYAPLFQMG